MSRYDPVDSLLRLTTHFNVGAALATALWILWSGWNVVGGRAAAQQPATDRVRAASVDATDVPRSGAGRGDRVLPAAPACQRCAAGGAQGDL